MVIHDNVYTIQFFQQKSKVCYGAGFPDEGIRGACGLDSVLQDEANGACNSFDNSYFDGSCRFWAFQTFLYQMPGL